MEFQLIVVVVLISYVFGDTQNKTRRNKERVKWESTDWGRRR